MTDKNVSKMRASFKKSVTEPERVGGKFMHLFVEA